MLHRRKPRRSEQPPPPPVRRALLIMTGTAVLAFFIVGAGTVLIAHRIARANALAEAVRSARSIADTVFVPALPAAIRGDATAIATLRRVVAARQKNGSIVRVKVWRRDGTIAFSDDPEIVGQRFPLSDDVIAVIDSQRSKSDVSGLDAAENFSESDRFTRLVEVYTPITLPDGRRFAFEIYSKANRVDAAEEQLTNDLVPLSLASLVVLLIAQLPISMWLVRRVVAAHQEHSRLLRNTLIASARERRTIARELHDGVVQDLAGVGYAVGALVHSLNGTASPAAARTLDRVSSAVQDSVSRLRTLMVDIYPPDLSSSGLRTAVEDLAAPLREQRMTVDVQIDLKAEPEPEVAATLYRSVREGLANIVKHAHATHVTLALTGDARAVTLRLHDDGTGLSAADLDRRAEGHIGLQLLRDAAADLGGAMTVSSEQGSGTTFMVELPTAGIPR